VKLLLYMSDKIAWSSRRHHRRRKLRLFIIGTEIPAEGCPHQQPTDDYYRYDRAGPYRRHRSGNSYRLGDTVRVSVAGVTSTPRTKFRPRSRADGPRKPASSCPPISRQARQQAGHQIGEWSKEEKSARKKSGGRNVQNKL